MEKICSHCIHIYFYEQVSTSIHLSSVTLEEAVTVSIDAAKRVSCFSICLAAVFSI